MVFLSVAHLSPTEMTQIENDVSAREKDRKAEIEREEERKGEETEIETERKK